MSFKVTIKDEDGKVVDDLEADCLVGALHVSGSEDYQGLFYADCDGVTALRCIRAATKVIAEKMNDEDIVQAMEEDESELVEDKPGDVN